VPVLAAEAAADPDLVTFRSSAGLGARAGAAASPVRAVTAVRGFCSGCVTLRAGRVPLPAVQRGPG
jgi:hypothetical protein